MIDEIRNHFEDEYPREGCGIIGIVQGKKKWFPCKNVAENEDDFIMCSIDYMKVKSKADIFAIVHSHPDATNEASQGDINNCNALGIPYYIFSYPDMELNILEPEKKVNDLFGREYEFGVTDCFEAMRDYLASQDINIPHRDAFEDDWWKKDLDYFTEDTIKQWNHSKVDNLQPNDVIIFSIESKVGNHCGVYLGNDIFYHHAENRLSCRESLYPFWAKYLTGIYRYDKA